MSKDIDVWVPDNLSALKKQVGKKPQLYGLPLFQLFYSKKFIDHDGIWNRIDDENKLTNAFRIIIGMTWNWMMADLAGLKLDKTVLDRSITAKCCLAAGEKNDNWKWNEILRISLYDNDYGRILRIHKELLLLYEDNKELPDEDKAASYEKFFSKKIAKYSTQRQVLNRFIPLKVQKKYVDENQRRYAFTQFKEDQESFPYKIRLDMSEKLEDWAKRVGEQEIRKNSWLNAKQAQRLLSKAKCNSLSIIYRRKRVINSGENTQESVCM
jgi:hypothetical protein